MENTHSPLGASAAERWMNCPGSVSLLSHLKLPETEEPDYTREGTLAHAVGAHCLVNGTDAWEMVGQELPEGTPDADMCEAVQVYLDTCRPFMVPHAKTVIEAHLSSPKHALMYGTVDFGAVADSLLNVVDYKHGIGVPVEVEDNPQLKYYAYLVLQDYPDVRRVVLRVVQPRCPHPDGPVRRWETTAEDICAWVERELVPAMRATELDESFMAGKWCRFCPAKLACPVMTGVFGAMATASKIVEDMSDAELGREWQMIDLVKMRQKALEAEVFRRLQLGRPVDGTKLVHKRADRVWKPEAADVFRAAFGDEANVPVELKSPAQMEKIAAAKAMVKEWAYTPESGLTVAAESDKRPAVKVATASEVFTTAVESE